MTHLAPPAPAAEAAPKHKLHRRSHWRPGLLSVCIVALAVAGLTVLLYPAAAQWLSTVNQASIVRNYAEIITSVEPEPVMQLAAAHAYNDDLEAGVTLEANGNVPIGTGEAHGSLAQSYDDLLRADSSGLMARVRIPSIDVDLPIYHGTSDETLLRGAGHLKGSSLPVGGVGTHSVITAHRGLASATMFTNLDKVKVGDTFSIAVFGEVLTYRVTDTKVVEPDDTDSLRAVPGKDLVTLVTCTPLGINTHRILVTGERVLPTPAKDVREATAPPTVPFPWWAVQYGAGLTGAGILLWRLGISDARAIVRRHGLFSLR